MGGIKEGLAHFGSIIGERLVESPPIFNSKGRMKLLMELSQKIKAGEEFTREDLNRISRLPSSWQETMQLCFDGARLRKEGEVLFKKL